MVCKICFQSGHDKQYCQWVFCRELVNELFDMTINENVEEVSMLSTEITLPILMSQHKRLGRESLLRHLNIDILFKILSLGKSTIIHETCILGNRKTVSNTIMQLKNSSSSISPIRIHNDEIYAVSNNTFVSSLNKKYDVAIGPIQDFIFYKEFVIVTTKAKDNSNYHVSFIKTNTTHIHWMYSISHEILKTILFKDFLFILTKNGKIIKLDLVERKIIYTHSFNKDIKYLYEKDDMIYITFYDKYSATLHKVNNNLSISELKIQYNFICNIDITDDIITEQYDDKCIIIRNSKYKLLNRFDVKRSIYFKPIILLKQYHIIVVTDKKKTIEYYEKNKSIKWTHILRARVSAQPYIDINHKYLYVGTVDKYMHKLCVNSGNLIWKSKIKGVPHGDMIYHKGMLYTQTTNPSNLIEIVT